MDLLGVMSGGFGTDKQGGVGGGTDIIYVTELKGTIEGLGTSQIIKIYRGDNRTLKVSVVDGDDAPVSLAGGAAKFSVKKRLSDGQARIDKSSAVSSEILILDTISTNSRSGSTEGRHVAEGSCSIGSFNRPWQSNQFRTKTLSNKQGGQNPATTIYRGYWT